MTGPEHYAAAEQNLGVFDRAAETGANIRGLEPVVGLAITLGAALVHAVLAHVAVTVDTCYEMDPPVGAAWFDAGTRT